MITTPELRDYINRINRLNNYDLEWEWYGNSDDPMIRVYEEADGHDLAYGTLADIKDNIKEALPSWSLKDPDDER